MIELYVVSWILAAFGTASSTSNCQITKTLNDACEIDQSRWQYKFDYTQAPSLFFTFKSDIYKEFVFERQSSRSQDLEVMSSQTTLLLGLIDDLGSAHGHNVMGRVDPQKIATTTTLSHSTIIHYHQSQSRPLVENPFAPPSFVHILFRDTRFAPAWVVSSSQVHLNARSIVYGASL